MKNDCKLFK